MSNFLSQIAQSITPNGFYLLQCINKKEEPKRINIEAELRLLQIEGWLTGKTLTDKAVNLLAEFDGRFKVEKGKVTRRKELDANDLENIKKFVDLFPKVATPTERRLRSTPLNLQNKFRSFFIQYNYDWETIHKATKKYILSFDPNNLTYMKSAEYFIMKDKVSLLANFCQEVVDGGGEDDQQINPLIVHKVL